MNSALDRVLLSNNIGRYKQAETEVRQYLSTNPDDSKAYELLSICLYNLSKYDLSIEAIQKALELEPYNEEYHWTFGDLCLRMDKLDQAEEYFIESISLNPEYADSYSSLSELYWMKGCISKQTKEPKSGCFQSGIDWARAGLEINPEQSNSICFLIRNLIATRKPECLQEAKELSESLLTLHPDNAMAHEIYGIVCTVQLVKKNKTIDDLKRIIPIFEEALRLNPERHIPKDFAKSLLSSHYFIVREKSPQWLNNILLGTNLFAFPFLLLALYFYNKYGFILFPAGIFAIFTILSMIPILDLSQYEIRIRKSPFKKFAESNTVTKVYWRVFFSILAVGFFWKFLPILIKNLIIFIVIIFLILHFVFAYLLAKRFFDCKKEDEKLRIDGIKNFTKNSKMM
jgi:tetratricopeptide (TPR) repeat protein